MTFDLEVCTIQFMLTSTAMEVIVASFPNYRAPGNEAKVIVVSV